MALVKGIFLFHLFSIHIYISVKGLAVGLICGINYQLQLDYRYPMARGIIGLPCSWGNLALQVGGVLKIQTIKYSHESYGTQI
jgi:hypothetical protein